MSEGLRVRAVSTGSSHHCNHTGRVQSSCRMCWISCAWPQAMQPTGFYLCSAWFAEAGLMFRAQKHRAKLVWGRKMLCFDSWALWESLSLLREARPSLCDPLHQTWKVKKSFTDLQATHIFLIFFLFYKPQLPCDSTNVFVFPLIFFPYLLTLLKYCSS